MKQKLIYNHEDLKKYNPKLYAELGSKFGEDWELMRKTNNNEHITLKDVESKFTKFRNKLGNKFMRIRHDLLEIEIKFERWDPINKKWILDRIIPGQSYTEQYIEFWYVYMYLQDITMNNITPSEISYDIGNTTTVNNTDGWHNLWNQSPNSATGSNSNAFGMLIGSGTTAFDLSDHNLETILTAWIHDFPVFNSAAAGGDLVGQSLTIAWSRLYRNTTGSQGTINEVGLVSRANYDFAVQSSFLLERTVLDSGFVVENNETVRLQYTLKVTAA